MDMMSLYFRGEFMEWVYQFPHLYSAFDKPPLHTVGLNETMYIKCLIWKKPPNMVWMVHSIFPIDLYLCLLFIMLTMIAKALGFQKGNQKGSDLSWGGWAVK